MRSPQSDNVGTATRILDVAQRLIQVRGFNAFSYADVAAVMDVTKASLHYHFPSKAVLGEALIARYITNFKAALDDIERKCPESPMRLHAYAEIYRSVIVDKRCCLCCMLASDYTTLPPAMQAGVRRFFEYNRDWLINVLQRGLRERELDYAGPTADVADFIVASLEGAMLTCWVDGGEARFARISQQLLAALSVCADA